MELIGLSGECEVSLKKADRFSLVITLYFKAIKNEFSK